MTVTYPQEVNNMKQKRKILQNNVELYHNSSKRRKSRMLEELEQITGYNRKYLIYLLNIAKKRIWLKKGMRAKVDLTKLEVNKRGRKKIYGGYLKKYLIQIWYLSELISSKHLYGFIHENEEWIFGEGRLKDVTERERELLLRMSASTIERMLKEEKKRQRSVFKYRSRRSVNNHIKRQVGVESFYTRRVDKIGYLEVDTVHHSGSSGKGEFFYTLTVVDVKSDWTSLRLLRNKARIWTYQALEGIFSSLPFVPYHLHSDNGSEFINAHIISFIRENGLKQTRSRSYRKNDNALVELKNWTMVRGYLGYRRYNTEEEYEIIEKLLGFIELLHNFFIPTMKKRVEEEENEKGKTKRIVYETKSPYRRLIESDEISDEKKRELKKMKKSVSLYRLRREISMCLKRLDEAYSKKHRQYNSSKLDISLSLKSLDQGGR